VRKGNGKGGGGVPALRISAEQACTVLYPRLPALDSRTLTESLTGLVGPCEVEWGRLPTPGAPLVAGTAHFGEHRVVMIALDAPVSREVLERTVVVSPMPEELRAEMLFHRAAIRLLYVGGSQVHIEQLTALYLVAGALLDLGGVGVLNERGAIAVPTERAVEHLLQLTGGVAPIQLWVGVVTFNLDDDPETEASRYLMRTYGMEQMRLPDLCFFMRDRTGADDAYHTLMNICLHMSEPSGQPLKEGDRVDFSSRSYLLTQPSEDIKDIAPRGQVLLVVDI
jgi:hypothetical protein